MPASPELAPSGLVFCGLSPLVWVQSAMLALLAAGALVQLPALSLAAAGLAVLATLIQWQGLIGLARVFLCLAIGLGLSVATLLPAARGLLVTALEQGVGFGALMMVLGLLRQPVRRARITKDAAETLLAARAKLRFPALLAGAHVMSLMFNVGIISMIGDLLRTQERPEGRDDHRARHAMVVAAMRGAALVSIWSPIGLGFAIVTAGLPHLNPITFMTAAAAFTGLVLLLNAIFPFLPQEMRAQPQAAEIRKTTAPGGALPVIAILAVSALLLAVAVTLHRLLGLGFTLVSVIVLPVFAFIWLLMETAQAQDPLGARIVTALNGLSDMRSETAIFMSANVIGAALSALIQHSAFGLSLHPDALPGLPVLLGCLVLIPVAAALYLPNSIVVVMAAQLLGQSPLGISHPLCLGLTLAIGWAMAVSVSPISAMCLITARYCQTDSRRVAHRWNLPFTILTTATAAAAICALYSLGL